MCRNCLCFCHLKHWRVCICIVSLESLCLVILLNAMHTVSQVSLHGHIGFYFMATFRNYVQFLPMPEVFKGERCERIQLLLWWPFTVCKCSDGSLQCRIDPVWSFSVSYCWRQRYSALCAVWVQRAAVALCHGKPDLDVRSKCMKAENLRTTYYLVLLFSYVNTCFKMWCISLYLPVLNTLCSSLS